MVIRLQFTNAHHFSEGLAAVQTGKWEPSGLGTKSWIVGKWAYIDKTGKLAIKAQFDAADPFSEGLAAVRVGRKWGYIDKSGNIVIEPQFEGNWEFSEGLAPVMITPSNK